MSEFLEFVREKKNLYFNKTELGWREKVITDCIYFDTLDDFLIFIHEFMILKNIECENILDKCISILDIKANDYSDKKDRYSSFHNTYKLARLVGLSGDKVYDVFIINYCQKISRIENLLQNNIDPKNESLIDSFIDLINYRLLFEGYKMGLQ